jgi:hypothetical protein
VEDSIARKVIMKPTLPVAALVVVAGLAAAPSEERSFHGQIVEIDLEGSILVVESSQSGHTIELRFEVDELTEIRASRHWERETAKELDEPMPIALSALELGDDVEIRYQVVKGTNVATVIERSRARHA